MKLNEKFICIILMIEKDMNERNFIIISLSIFIL